MAKLNITEHVTTSYIYHMLSVSKCGYDNAYGRKYRTLHNQSDLNLLKEFEPYLSVSGGEHQGDLYSVCVAVPASLIEIDKMVWYLKGIRNLFDQKNPPMNYKKYEDIYKTAFNAFKVDVNEESHGQFYKQYLSLSSEIVSVCNVLLRNLDIYINNIYKKEKPKSVHKLQKQIDSLKILDRWEEILNVKYPENELSIILVESIEHGANAIDISYNKDVFYCDENRMDMINLISHEVGILLFKYILRKSDYFQNRKHYLLVENLAEYYNTKILPSFSRSFTKEDYLSFFSDWIKKHPNQSILEVLQEAEKNFSL